VLQPLDLTIPDGSFTVLVGPSGCGKSTLLRLLAGLETLSGGTILMNKRPVNDLDPADRDVAMVFQSYALYPHLTVAENLAFHMQVKKVDKQLQKSKVQQVASLLGIDKLLARYPRALSGGQRQAIAIARAAAFDPKVLIMDEPTAALAVAEVEAVLELIRRVSARGVSVILITHRLQDLFLVCDRIMVMYEGTNVADRRVSDTSLSDIVNLIVGEKFTARSAAAH